MNVAKYLLFIGNFEIRWRQQRTVYQLFVYYVYTGRYIAYIYLQVNVVLFVQKYPFGAVCKGDFNEANGVTENC